jgi:hypothetical protein
VVDIHPRLGFDAAGRLQAAARGILVALVAALPMSIWPQAMS